MLSKLRISGHKHSIECCRYLNISKHERICTACNSGEVEDEEHSLLNCSLYKASSVFKTSKIQSSMSYLKIILYNYNHYMLKVSSNFIENVKIKEDCPLLNHICLRSTF